MLVRWGGGGGGHVVGEEVQKKQSSKRKADTQTQEGRHSQKAQHIPLLPLPYGASPAPQTFLIDGGEGGAASLPHNGHIKKKDILTQRRGVELQLPDILNVSVLPLGSLGGSRWMEGGANPWLWSCLSPLGG